MAAPKRQRPSRYLATVALALVALYLGVFLGPAQKPALGLDLRGGTEVTLTAVPLAGTKTITQTDLNTAVDIIRDRVNGLGVGGAEVNKQGSHNIVVSVPGKARKQVVDLVGATGLLRFRQVLAYSSFTPTVVPSTSASVSPTPTATTSGKPGKRSPSSKKTPTTGASPSASHTPTAKKTKAASGAALSSILEKASPSATPASTPSSSVAPSPAVSSVTAATPTPSPSVSGSAAADATGDAPAPNTESPTLSTAFVSEFEAWDCSKDNNPTNGNDVASDYIIACDPGQSAKYILGPTALSGNQVASASADLGSTGVQWTVNLSFTGSGSSAWYNLTKTSYEATGSASSGFPTCAPPKGCNATAIVLDGIVQSAPASEVDGISGAGSTQITGNFTQSSAQNLANVLKYGSLPLKFDIPTAESVSATLGKSQLHGGLIAGAIGLGLVIIFSLLYYRALGLVTVGSLAVSGLILYAVTTLLGHSSVGYTLSLPGIAGFIVAVGITADSFVVFFERIRDEIREGRRLRSAVERGWPRARRTIISADFISLLASLILYAVTIGDVRGFAFTLGLSTLSDLFIVFFFTKPLLTVLAKYPAFDSGKRWTGIGKARAGVLRDTDDSDRPSPRPRRTRTREA